MLSQTHFAKHAFLLQFFLKHAQCLIDIVVTNDDLHALYSVPVHVAVISHDGV